MFEKLMIINQSLILLVALALIFLFLNVDQNKRLNELELRQTNTLSYLEGKINNVDSKLDAATNELRQGLKVLELRSR